MDALHDHLLRPLAIGPLRLDRRLFMAPMAGISTSAFRREVRRWGAGLVFTEMISAQGLDHENRRTRAYLACGEDEHPIGFQLFGAEPGALGRAARACVAAGADLVDLNMACPVRKVMKTGAGAALLGTPELAEACLRAAVEAVEGGVPVTVKIRTGVRRGDEAGRRLALRLVAAGAAAVCIHPRYASQLYGGRADHAVTVALAGELPVPVIASGDIATARPDGSVERGTCLELLDTGVAAVMVARAALGRPWVFHELIAGEGAPPPAERRSALRRFVEGAEAELGERAVGYLRRFWPKYRRSGAVAPALAKELMRAPDLASVGRLLDADVE
jgi:tRNA-dihydrouridine synthase B